MIRRQEKFDYEHKLQYSEIGPGAYELDSTFDKCNKIRYPAKHSLPIEHKIEKNGNSVGPGSYEIDGEICLNKIQQNDK